MRKTFQEIIDEGIRLKVFCLNFSNLGLNGFEPEWKKVEEMYYVTELKISGNLLQNLDCIAGLKSLVCLDVSENKISDIGVISNLTNLKELIVRKNLIKDFQPIENLIHLQYLDMSENPINGTITKQDYLKGLAQIMSLLPKEDKFEFIIKEIQRIEEFVEKEENMILERKNETYFSINPIFGKFLINNFGKIEKNEVLYSLCLKSKIIFKDKINTLKNDIFDKMTTLKHLNMRGNVLINIPSLVNLKSLQTLLLSRNQIQDITPLTHLKNLKTLDLEKNKIQDLSPVLVLSNLKNLYASDNEITSLTSTKTTNLLENLTLSNNLITDISTSFLEFLNPNCDIRLASNPIQNIPEKLYKTDRIVSWLLKDINALP